MTSAPTGFNATTVKHLFATPLVMAELPAAVTADLNPKITQIVMDRAARTEGNRISNIGGWQSDDQILEWGGAPVASLLASMRGLINQITIYVRDQKSLERAEIEWKIHGWANINRQGHANAAHVHPGAYWSAVYYVAVDESEGKGGEIEFSDPRGCLPSMYCPVLRMGIQGYLTAGGNESHRPRAGQCIIFPSWLYHSVKAYTGDMTRISLAFNFGV